MLNIYDKYVSLKYKIYTEKTTEDKTVNEIFQYTNIDFPILLIENLVVDKMYRGHRFGARVLRELLNINKDKLIIINLKYMNIDREEHTNREKVESVIRLGKYFKKLGFIDINAYFGKYNDKISMCYDNIKYKELVEK